MLTADVTGVDDGLPLDGNGDGVGGDDYNTGFFILPGDFNGDRSVDQADYDIWQANYGQAGTYADGDANGNGVVDDSDAMYMAWGTTLPAIPTSPSTLVATSATGAGRSR